MRSHEEDIIDKGVPWFKGDKEMTYHLLADLVFVLHLAFICFVIGGGLLAWRRLWVAVPHLATVIWGMAMEFLPAVPCPLTGLEQALLLKAGVEGYYGGFVDHYLVHLIYPDVSPHFFIASGFFLLAVNGVIYALLIMRIRAKNAKR
jgi:hypothetical protein